MSPSHNQMQAGDTVYSNDDDQVGTVIEVQPAALVVGNDFFPRDYAIPFTAISRAGNGEVVLNVSSSAVLRSGWDTVPAGTAMGSRDPKTFSADVMATSNGEGISTQMMQDGRRQA